jgi:hypothetical protein
VRQGCGELRNTGSGSPDQQLARAVNGPAVPFADRSTVNQRWHSRRLPHRARTIVPDWCNELDHGPDMDAEHRLRTPIQMQNAGRPGQAGAARSAAAAREDRDGTERKREADQPLQPMYEPYVSHLTWNCDPPLVIE